MTSNVAPRTIAPPSLPLPTAQYSAVHQNILATTIQQFGTRTANAINQLLNNTQTPAYTVGTLPSAGTNKGKLAYVTDGAASLTWGDAVTTGGSVTYLVWSNGLHWTVIGK